MPAALHSVAQPFLISTMWPFAPVPGNTNVGSACRGCPPARRGCDPVGRGPVRTAAPRGGLSASCSTAASTTRPCSRSRSAQRADSTSPRLAPVRSSSRTMFAACRSGYSANAFTSRPSSSPDRYRRRWCSMLRSRPFAGLVSRMPQRIARLNIFDMIATVRFAAYGAPLLVILRWSASTSAKVTSATLACGPKCGRTCMLERAAVLARVRAASSEVFRPRTGRSVRRPSAPRARPRAPPAGRRRRRRASAARAPWPAPPPRSTQETGRWCRSGRGRCACSSRTRVTAPPWRSRGRRIRPPRCRA